MNGMPLFRFFIAVAAILGALAVVLGAFGAHALKAKLTADQLSTFETGIRYHFYHALALLILAFISVKLQSSILPYVGYLWLIGIVLFSGSIYLLATKEILGIEHWNWLGPITPIGGTLLIIGWILLFISVLIGDSG